MSRKLVLTGSQWVDSLTLSVESLNVLFGALFLTLLQVLIVGNLIVRDFLVFKTSLSVFITCACLILVFYGFSAILRNLVTALLSTYFCMLLITKIDGFYSIPFFYMLALLGLITAGLLFRVDLAKLKIIILMAAIAVIVILGHPDQYTTFDILRRANSGSVYNDTLYHASLAAMIKNYNVVSTGLNGLIETPYHIFSHILFASISKISGAGVLEVYGMAPQLLFIPILIFAITCVTLLIGKKNALAIPIIWIMVSIILFFFPIFFGRWNFWNSYFGSESYLISLPLFLFGLILLFKRTLNLTDVVLAVASSGMIATSKGPVGLIYAGLWLLRVLFFRTEKTTEIVIFIFSAAATAFVVFDSVVTNAPTEFVFLHFISHYSFHGKDLLYTLNGLAGAGEVKLTSLLWAVIAVLTFLVFHFLLSIYLIANTVKSANWKSIFLAPATLYSLGAMLAGLLIISLIKIAGGSAYYFTNVAFFVSLPYFVILLLNFYEEKKMVLPVKKPDHFFICLILSILLVASYKTFKETYSVHVRYARQNSDFIASLISLRETPINHIYNNSLGQKVNNPFQDCVAQAFVYPAISERPWMNVISFTNNCFFEFYGFSEYGITAKQQKVTVPPKLQPDLSIVNWPIE